MVSRLVRPFKKITAVFFFISFAFVLSPPAANADNLFTGQEEILKGLSLSYQLKLDEAVEVFSTIEKKYPQSPAGTFYVAVMKWGYIESGARWGKLAKLYASSQPPRPEFPQAKNLLQKMRDTIDRCEEILKSEPDNFEAIFYMAGAYGFAARMEFYQGYYISAMMNGKKSAGYFDKLLVAYPDNGDAMLGPGVYKYYVGRLSPPMRFLVSLLGLKGSKEEGISLIQKANETALLSSIESADFLARIYSRHENDFEKALLWADKLESKIPQSPLADFHRLMVFNSKGELEKEEEALKSLLGKAENFQQEFRGNWKSLFLFSIGVIRDKNKDHESAEHYFKKVLKTKGVNDWLKTEIKARLKRQEAMP